MRTLLVTFASLAAACGSVQSADQCCVDEADCALIKSQVVLPCETGQVCTAQHECVVAECRTSMDCSAEAPICRVGFCESVCLGEEDCADVAGRTHCSPDGACVGCVDSTHCSGNTAFCDAEDSVCRGCERDNECASGVCIESEGICALEADILYVATGPDTGDCTKLQPCSTLGYAVSKITPGSSRHVVRVEGGFANNESTTINVSTRVVIDGTGTRVQKPTSALPWMSVSGAGQAILGGLTIEGDSSMSNPNIRVMNAALTLGPNTTLKSYAQVSSGTLVVHQATVDDGAVGCTSGTLTIDRATFDDSAVHALNCQLSIHRSRFTKGSDGILEVTGGKATVENSLFVNTYEFSDSLRITSAAPGSSFRFNTVANLSGINSDGVALSCDANLKVSSNIFAYRSQHPLGYQPACTAEFSIFDDHALASALTSSDSQFVPFTSIFTDPVGRDFTLSASSAARNAADPTITDVLIDIDGRGRPVGAADAGAFEAP